MEIWKDIEGFEGIYQVSNLGRVKSLSRVVRGPRRGFRSVRERILKYRITSKGYALVQLCKPKVQQQVLVHRLVAQAFIPNPLGLKLVNHKDENPLNCQVENLEWCTHKYNSNYGTFPERQRKYAKEHPRYRNPITGKFESKRSL